MDLHIGKLIEEKLLESGMTKNKFASKINKARQNVNDILRRVSCDTQLLYDISKALNYDFFQHYINALHAEVYIPSPNNEYMMLREQMVMNDREKADLETKLAVAQKEVELQKTIIDLLRKQIDTLEADRGK